MVKNYRIQRYTPVLLLVVIFCSFVFYSFSTGITGVTLKNGDGCICHDPNPAPGVSVTISGPDSLQIKQTGVYIVTISGGPLVRGGTNIAASLGILAPQNSDLQLIGDELTHVTPKVPSGNSVTFQFSYTAPATIGNQTLYANGNSVNFNGDNTGDSWNFASNKTITVVPEVPVELTGFTATVSGNNVTLTWSTSTEINNKGYEIFRSEDERNWEKIGFINGAGNSTEKLEYTFTDRGLVPGLYYYRLKQIDFNGSFEYFSLNEKIEINIPSELILKQNYPNPFNPSTRIEYSVPFDGNVQLIVYNSLGIEVTGLVNGFTTSGDYYIYFNGTDLSSGVYYYEIQITGHNNKSYRSIKKMILMK